MIPFPYADVDGTIWARFERVAKAQPNAIAVADGDKSWTYQDVLDATGAYANAFSQLRQGQAAALVFSHNAEAIFALIGAIRAGVPAIPIDPQAPPASIPDCLIHCQVVVTQADHAQWCRENVGDIPVAVGADGLACSAAANHDGPPPEPTPTGACVIYLTSGTTGGAKGAVRSNRALCRHVWQLPEYHGYGPDDRQAHMSSFAFGGSVPVVLGGLLTGGTIDIFDLRKTDAAGLARAIRQRGVTILQLTPSLMRELVDILSAENDDWQPRLIVVGGENLHGADILALRDRLGWTCPVVHRLASSEAGVIAEWQVDLQGLTAQSAVPVGYAVKNRELTIVDEQDQPVATGEIGEIVITGDYLASGYWQRPDLNEGKFFPAPLPDSPSRQRLKTGDMGRLRDDGLLEFLGRMDSLVKIRGYRVELGAVETGLRQLPGVSDAAVVVQSSQRGSDYLVAYVQRGRNAQVNAPDLRAELQGLLPDYMVPRRVVVLDEFPLTSGGKLARKRLPPIGRERPEGMAAIVPPKTEMQRRLAGIWSEILEIDDISLRDDFFDLGGDSLDALQVAMTLQKQLDVQFFETDLFRQSDLTGMAETAEILCQATKSPRSDSI
ncbi:MAG: non-ribosomal peptide synthetase [Rhodobacteraceae bacterium]|nr:non-ribosomal peptide synthetase [Paracoccaceae bacterium]